MTLRTGLFGQLPVDLLINDKYRIEYALRFQSKRPVHHCDGVLLSY